jgi:hypothetical protein
MIELFARGGTSPTFQNLREKLLAQIASLSDEQILGSNIDEWVKYYFDEYKIQPIKLWLENKISNMEKIKIETRDFRFVKDWETDTAHVDGYKIIFTIPFEGDEILLHLRPSHRYLSSFPVDAINNGNIVFSLKYIKQDLEKDATPEKVASRFDNQLKNYVEMIIWINEEVEQFNLSLTNAIRTALENRKKKTDDFILLGEKLSIPLKNNPNAPNTVPIHLKKVPVEKPQMPSIRPKEKDYAIPESDYTNIRRIISLAGLSMEKAAKTFTKLEEEELRDVFIAFLNTHYLGTVTGETFSKTGKTDIHICFENKAAYVAECKVWHGEKSLQNALEQLFSYTTWRDAKTSIIIFNKGNKDFIKLLGTIKAFLSKCEKCQNRTSVGANEWLCDFKRNKEASDVMKVHIIAFDLCLATNGH